MNPKNKKRLTFLFPVALLLLSLYVDSKSMSQLLLITSVMSGYALWEKNLAGSVFYMIILSLILGAIYLVDRRLVVEDRTTGDWWVKYVVFLLLVAVGVVLRVRKKKKSQSGCTT